MGVLGVDYSTPIAGSDVVATRIGSDQITVVFRYATQPDWPKSLTAAEYADLVAHGLRVCLLYEETADFMTAGYAYGQNCARRARGYARAVGAPDTEPIIYSLDIDADAAQMDAALAFLEGAASVDGGIGNVGAYGKYDFVRLAMNVGFLGFGTEAWSAGQHDGRAIAWQRAQQVIIAGAGGSHVDVDVDDLHPGYFTDSSTGGTVSTIPPSIAAKWPALAGDFPPNAPYTDETALIWADAGARFAAYQTTLILNEMQQLTNAANAQTAALAALTEAIRNIPANTGGIDAGTLAAAIISHIHVS